ncbi:N-acetyltransferase [Flavobacterium sediminilitoris]|uniref:N-acetyltransferase n=2 Tax=Flavobacteriaceae TaxID=49546 RepID=A0ABY4HU41_9FLAO|nr:MULTISPECIES: N-acetyltransferase [Flavobacterium]UOX35656.1 N-acetyltransferase [Flavobacterium sediminilitoris]
MENSAKVRGTGIAKRSVEYLNKKITEGNAIIAITEENEWAGFCYIETWSEEKFVVNSGLIVAPKYRIMGLARSIKKEIFKLSRQKYPEAKIFGLTTGLAVMKINSELGYEPITYSEITQDEKFWDGCKSCINYEILISKNKKNCLCTAMMYDKDDKLNQKRENEENSFSI